MSETAQAAVLFVDVSGSTRLYESAGDAVAHAAIDRCINIFKDKTAVIGGRVIKTIGDERTNVTFYSDVRVPDKYRIGEVNGGVKVMAMALTIEQASGDLHVMSMKLLLRQALRTPWAHLLVLPRAQRVLLLVLP